MRKLFTSESVTEGHPDKLCDYIADSVLDAFLVQDSKSRVACECLAGKNLIVIAGEITSKASVDIEEIVRNAIMEIGYTDEKTDIDYKTCDIVINISKQSPDIALGVDNSLESKESRGNEESKEDGKSTENNEEKAEGAGDQGMVFGYACNETESLLPMPIYLAHKLARRLSEVRKTGEIPYLRPDGKVQVTVEYEGDKPIRIDTIVVSTQHEENVDLEVLKQDIREKVINAVVDAKLLDSKTKYYINPTGRFVIGGPLGDTGLTGRKIIVDTYGGYARHGGGSFSGKDATKVDRSASYMARYVAKNIVANGYADRCEVQISYAIGVAEPVSVTVNTFGTGKVSDEEIIMIIERNFDLTPRGIINSLDLERPIYKLTSNYGHFGKEGLMWERVVELR